MATFAQVKEIRLRIDDPAGFQDFVEVANEAALPATPAPYTAYKLTDTGAYVATELESGAVAADYVRHDIRVSDDRIEAWIDAYSVDQAECRALQAMQSRIGNELTLKRASVGTEDITYTNLIELYNYYKALSDQCKEKYNETQNNSTGRYGTSTQPEVAGGEI